MRKIAKTFGYFAVILVVIAFVFIIPFVVAFITVMIVPLLIAGAAWFIAKMLAYDEDEEKDKPP